MASLPFLFLAWCAYASLALKLNSEDFLTPTAPKEVTHIHGTSESTTPVFKIQILSAGRDAAEPRS
jgi:hypothetical protein